MGSRYQWIEAPPEPGAIEAVVRSTGVSALLGRLLVNRGVGPGEAAAFLDPKLKDLSDPFALAEMDRAVERLRQARERAEPILIFGDYDVDGVTSTALLAEVLGALGWTVRCYLPLRLDDGYGLTQAAVEKCLDQSPCGLVIAVDCGTNSREVISWLKSRCVDVIVVDHHQAEERPRDAAAVINPHLPNRSGELKELCSVGLAFKLAHGLVKKGRGENEAAALNFDVRSLLDLAALGTVADLVPLLGENRILARRGLEALASTPRPGLRALKEVAGVTGDVGPFEVGFQLGPRLNAAGRLETAELSLRLIESRSYEEALPIAQALDVQNVERQRIEKEIVEAAVASAREAFTSDSYVIVEGNHLWHVGVVGIVASRICREFHRPAIIIGCDGVEWRGSGRSIEGFDLAAALRECDDLLLRHGGHAMAAGLSIHPDQLIAFRKRLNELARTALKDGPLKPALRVDASVALGDLTIERLEELRMLEPNGMGNPTPQMIVKGVRFAAAPRRIGKTGQHLKFRVTDGASMTEGVWWNGADEPLPDGEFDLACSPQINEFNGRRMVQLKAIDWRSSLSAE